MARPRTQSLSLGDHWNEFIAERLDNGRYTSASEVVRSALRLLEKREAEEAQKQELLQRALIEGEQSGDAGIFDAQAIRSDIRSELGLP